MKVEELDQTHLIELGYDFNPDGLFGYVQRDQERIAWVMSIFMHEGLWWACFDVDGDVPRSVHRYALIIKKALIEAGLDEIWTQIQVERPNAEKWLIRLGFKPVEGINWRLDLGRHSRSDWWRNFGE